jgi:hypothetical protein
MRGMNREAVAAVMDRPISRELLGSSVPARLAYVGVDGDPRVVPVGFVWDGASLVVCTASRSAKVAALRRHPRVAVTIDTDGFPPRVLLVRGSASVEVVDGVPDEFVEGARPRVPADQFAGWEAGVRALYAQMARITIVPDWAKLLDFETTLPKAEEDLVAANQRQQQSEDER